MNVDKKFKSVGPSYYLVDGREIPLMQRKSTEGTRRTLERTLKRDVRASVPEDAPWNAIQFCRCFVTWVTLEHQADRKVIFGEKIGPLFIDVTKWLGNQNDRA